MEGAQLNDPQVRRQVGREVHGERRAVFAGCRDRGLHRAAGVDDQDVAGFEEVRQVPEAGVDHAVVVPVGDHQAHLVAREAAGLGGLARLQLRRQVEVEHVEGLLLGEL